MAQLEVRPVRRKYHRTCANPDCRADFEGSGLYCGPGCYPSQTKEARRAQYAATKDRVLAERKAARAAAGPGPRARKRLEVLRLLAEEPHLSDREVAAKAGVSTQAVWKIRRATPGTRPSRPWRQPAG
jgi:hypothetical protein